MPLPLPYAPVQHCAAYAACTVRRHFLFHAKYAAGQYYNVVYLPLYPLSTRLIYPALYVYSIYMHVTVSRQGTSTATTTIDLCVLSTNSVPKLVCHASCSHAFFSPGIPLVLLWFFSHAPQLPLFNLWHSGWATAEGRGVRKGGGECGMAV